MFLVVKLRLDSEINQENFLKDVIAPVMEENKELLGVKAEINV